MLTTSHKQFIRCHFSGAKIGLKCFGGFLTYKVKNHRDLLKDFDLNFPFSAYIGGAHETFHKNCAIRQVISILHYFTPAWGDKARRIRDFFKIPFLETCFFVMSAFLLLCFIFCFYLLIHTDIFHFFIFVSVISNPPCFGLASVWLSILRMSSSDIFFFFFFFFFFFLSLFLG